jgi:hypothetical protein
VLTSGSHPLRSGKVDVSMSGFLGTHMCKMYQATRSGCLLRIVAVQAFENAKSPYHELQPRSRNMEALFNFDSLFPELKAHIFSYTWDENYSNAARSVSSVHKSVHRRLK